MAKIIKSQFLIIEGTGEEFMKAGCGGGEAVDQGVIPSGIFKGFSMISIEPAGMMCCDSCNTGILPSETCYYVAALNRVLCDKCYKEWHDGATYYPEDAPYEKRHFAHMLASINEAGVQIERE